METKEPTILESFEALATCKLRIHVQLSDLASKQHSLHARFGVDITCLRAEMGVISTRKRGPEKKVPKIQTWRLVYKWSLEQAWPFQSQGLITAGKQPGEKELAKRFTCISFYYAIQTFRMYAKLEQFQWKAHSPRACGVHPLMERNGYKQGWLPSLVFCACPLIRNKMADEVENKGLKVFLNLTPFKN